MSLHATLKQNFTTLKNIALKEGLPRLIVQLWRQACSKLVSSRPRAKSSENKDIENRRANSFFFCSKLLYYNRWVFNNLSWLLSGFSVHVSSPRKACANFILYLHVCAQKNQTAPLIIKPASAVILCSIDQWSVFLVHVSSLERMCKLYPLSSRMRVKNSNSSLDNQTRKRRDIILDRSVQTFKHDIPRPLLWYFSLARSQRIPSCCSWVILLKAHYAKEDA